jgi:predicted DNA-binding transcriptional regulator AlpA
MPDLKRSDLVNAREVGAMFGLNARHVVDRLSKKRDFPKGRRPGKEILWFKKDVVNWFNNKA